MSYLINLFFSLIYSKTMTKIVYHFTIYEFFFFFFN